MNDGTRTVHFGKYKGKTIEEIPSGYLRWMRDNCEEDDLVDDAARELQFRDDHSTHFEE